MLDDGPDLAWSAPRIPGSWPTIGIRWASDFKSKLKAHNRVNFEPMRPQEIRSTVFLVQVEPYT
jgi:hypothetical protein